MVQFKPKAEFMWADIKSIVETAGTAIAALSGIAIGVVYLVARKRRRVDWLTALADTREKLRAANFDTSGLDHEIRGHLKSFAVVSPAIPNASDLKKRPEPKMWLIVVLLSISIAYLWHGVESLYYFGWSPNVLGAFGAAFNAAVWLWIHFQFLRRERVIFDGYWALIDWKGAFWFTTWLLENVSNAPKSDRDWGEDSFKKWLDAKSITADEQLTAFEHYRALRNRLLKQSDDNARQPELAIVPDPKRDTEGKSH